MITPIIMEENIAQVGAKMLALKERGIDNVHLDFGDGLFSDLLTIAPADLQAVDTAGMKMDLHLMVDDPAEWVEECVALNPKRVIGQIERMGSQLRFLEIIAGYGSEGGLALAIETPIEEIETEVIKECKTILLLAVPTGTTGSTFDSRVIDKIKELRKVYKGKILVDGGINPVTYKQVMEAGATEAGANSAYWRGEWQGSDSIKK